MHSSWILSVIVAIALLSLGGANAQINFSETQWLNCGPGDIAWVKNYYNGYVQCAGQLPGNSTLFASTLFSDYSYTNENNETIVGSSLFLEENCLPELLFVQSVDVYSVLCAAEELGFGAHKVDVLYEINALALFNPVTEQPISPPVAVKIYPNVDKTVLSFSQPYNPLSGLLAKSTITAANDVGVYTVYGLCEPL